MKSEKITKDQYDKKVKKLQKQNTDFFGDNKLSTLSNSGNSYFILTFDDVDERDSFIESWNETINVSQKDRGYKGNIEKLKV